MRRELFDLRWKAAWEVLSRCFFSSSVTNLNSTSLNFSSSVTNFNFSSLCFPSTWSALTSSVRPSEHTERSSESEEKYQNYFPPKILSQGSGRKFPPHLMVSNITLIHHMGLSKNQTDIAWNVFFIYQIRDVTEPDKSSQLEYCVTHPAPWHGDVS